MAKYSKTYKKTHTSKKALEKHSEKILARGGKFKVNGLSIEYKFPVKEKRIPTWVFTIVLWDKTGNDLLEKHTMKVKRVNQETAYNVVRKKYKHPYFIELETIE